MAAESRDLVRKQKKSRKFCDLLKLRFNLKLRFTPDNALAYVQWDLRDISLCFAPTRSK